MHFLSNVAFGDVENSDMTSTIKDVSDRIAASSNYQTCAPGQLVSEYASTDLSKTKPTLDFTLPEVKAYEACGDERTRKLASLVMNLSDEDAAANLAKVDDIDGLIRDINDFKTYLQVKIQTTKGLTTPQFDSWYYEQYWGNWTLYRRASGLFGAESVKRANKKQALAQLVKSQASFQLSTQIQDFYLDLSKKYGPRFSLGEQKKLKDFFVDTTVYEWKIEDFLSVGQLLERELTHEDVAKYYMYVPMAVTGYYFEGKDKSPTDYVARVKEFSDAAKRALTSFIGPLNGATAISMDTASKIAQKCNNDATCIANHFRDVAAGAVEPVGDKVGVSAGTVVFVAATTFVLWKFLKK